MYNVAENTNLLRETWAFPTHVFEQRAQVLPKGERAEWTTSDLDDNLEGREVASAVVVADLASTFY